MSTASLSLWNSLLWWLSHPGEPQFGHYGELLTLPFGEDVSTPLNAFFDGHRLHAQRIAAALEPVANRIRDTQILLVPAFLSGPLLKWESLPVAFAYLNAQVTQLQRDGFDVAVAAIDPAARVEANARIIAAHIEEAPKPVLIVTHSKGGLDTLDALVHAPALTAHVAGWIAFQAPFFGSPIADVACATPRATRVSTRAMRLFGGEVGAIRDLTTGHRVRYMEANAGPIADIAAAIPVLSVATELNGSRSVASFLMHRGPTTRWIDSLALPNDGIVPVASAILPGSRYGVIKGLMHGEPACRLGFWDRKLDRVDLLKACFALVMRDRLLAATEAGCSTGLQREAS